MLSYFVNVEKLMGKSKFISVSDQQIVLMLCCVIATLTSVADKNVEFVGHIVYIVSFTFCH